MNVLEYGTYDDLPDPADAAAFVVTAPPELAGVYVSDGTAWALNGGSQPVLTEFATWIHTGAPDGSSNSFDYVEDQTATDPSEVIVVDDSADWVTFWGYPVPMVTEQGRYAVFVQFVHTENTAEAGDYLQLQFILEVLGGLPDGDNLPPWGEDFSPRADASYTYPGGSADGGYPYAALSAPLYLPAGTHFDFDSGMRLAGSLSDTPPSRSQDSYVLIIQRIA